MFCYDIETISDRENAVVLSAALVWFDDTATYTYEELLNKVCFVKFDAKEQLQKYGRKANKETIDWWKKQAELVRNVSLTPYPEDVTAEEGVGILKDYIKKMSVGDEIVWTRGSLDQVVSDSLCKDSLNTAPLFNYAAYRDMRTAIDLLKNTAKWGYCGIPGFDKNKVYKHDPRHDVVYDIFMLLYGE